VFSYPSGEEVLPIGGFTGTGPSPTLAALQDDISAGEFHLVLAFPSADPRMVWIATHCRTLPAPGPALPRLLLRARRRARLTRVTKGDVLSNSVRCWACGMKS
jgi:hypothetical protein